MIHWVLDTEVVIQKKTNTILQIFVLMTFIEKKPNNYNDNLCKIHVGLNNASALIVSVFDFDR